ncbi:hypothetical protein ACFU8W_44180 [Streptomyces sp. NPDC057565]|uniref:hypothetical protein n=1 Tax=Streptomyces sp. NPDC057565 TaxID=3346169 RepID=UPI003684B1EF
MSSNTRSTEAGVGQELEDRVAEPSGEERVVFGDAVLAAAVDVPADQLAEPGDRLQASAPPVVDGLEDLPGLFGPVALVARLAADAPARTEPEDLPHLHALVADELLANDPRQAVRDIRGARAVKAEFGRPAPRVSLVEERELGVDHESVMAPAVPAQSSGTRASLADWLTGSLQTTTPTCPYEAISIRSSQ